MNTMKVGLFDLDSALAPPKPENLTAEEWDLAKEIATEAVRDLVILGRRTMGEAILIVSAVKGASQDVSMAAVAWTGGILNLLCGEKLWSSVDAGRLSSVLAATIRTRLEDGRADSLLIQRARGVEVALECYELGVKVSVGMPFRDEMAAVIAARWSELTLCSGRSTPRSAETRPPSSPDLTPLCVENSPPYAPTPVCAENQGGSPPTSEGVCADRQCKCGRHGGVR